MAQVDNLKQLSDEERIKLHNGLIFPFAKLKGKITRLDYVQVSKDEFEILSKVFNTSDVQNPITKLIQYPLLSKSIEQFLNLQAKHETDHQIKIPAALIIEICDAFYYAVNGTIGAKKMPGDYELLKKNRQNFQNRV